MRSGTVHVASLRQTAIGVDDPIPSDVADFLSDRISTASEMDVVLLLRRCGEPRTASDVGRDIRLGEHFAELLLERLVQGGLARRVDHTYVLAADAESCRTLDRMAQLAPRYRLRLIRCVVLPRR